MVVLVSYIGMKLCEGCIPLVVISWFIPDCLINVDNKHLLSAYVLHSWCHGQAAPAVASSARFVGHTSLGSILFSFSQMNSFA